MALQTWTRDVHGTTVHMSAEHELEPWVQVLMSLWDGVPPGLLVDGYTVRIGWGPLQLQERPDGLVVAAPSHGVEEPHWQDDLTTDVRVFGWQRALEDRIRRNGPMSRYDEVVLVEDGVAEARSVGAQRFVEPVRGDSGWLVWVADAEAPRRPVRSVAVESLLVVRPSVLQLLGQPAGTFALLQDDEVTAVVGPDGDDLWGTGHVREVPEHPLVAMHRAAVASLPVGTPAWRLQTYVVGDGTGIAVVQGGRGGATAVAAADLSTLVSGSHEDLDTTLTRFLAGERTHRP
ncbi:hypothetical protein [Nocardioides plantarum]|uniref:Imm33-like domain-containing protein n=1 Tax=Nocardioides plantarum TaxID=29299 RepID=A0ABV5K848_9ACTN|nr:hypothetical protein [Nocardioides plantarum]